MRVTIRSKLSGNCERYVPINAIVYNMPLETRGNMPLWAFRFVLHCYSKYGGKMEILYIHVKDEKYEKMSTVTQHCKT